MITKNTLTIHFHVNSQTTWNIRNLKVFLSILNLTTGSTLHDNGNKTIITETSVNPETGKWISSSQHALLRARSGV